MNIPSKCPACGLDPYEYVDVGIGMLIPVSVNCCELGVMIIEYGYTMEAARAAVQNLRTKSAQGGSVAQESDDIPF